jgi:hypothetical protein
MGVTEGGAPFTTRLFYHTKGLGYPPQLTSFPFICEGCTVRVLLRRELIICPTDIYLLKLERVRMFDMAYAWIHGTHGALTYYLRCLVTFSDKYGVPTLLNTPLIKPPAIPVIPIQWTVSAYTLQQYKRTKNTITYNSARALQSKADDFKSWTLALAHPDTMYKSPNNRMSPPPPLTRTYYLMANLTNTGMRRHLGT